MSLFYNRVVLVDFTRQKLGVPKFVTDICCQFYHEARDR